jgi:hypothetical protein
MRKLTTEQFIQKAVAKHGNKYSYEKVNYKGSKDKVIIICKKHGEFMQAPANHLHGFGCGLCAKNFNYDTNFFIKKAKEIHGDKFDYSLSEYKNAKKLLTIICKKHGPFKLSPSERPLHKWRGFLIIQRILPYSPGDETECLVLD